MPQLPEVLVPVSTLHLSARGRENANIDPDLGFIWRISVKVMDRIVSAILGSANRYRALWSLFAILVTLCALLRKFSNWPNVWDITLWDETMYLGVGLTNLSDLTHGLQHYQESPLYSKSYDLIASLTGAEAPSVFMLGGLSAVLLALFGVAIGLFAGSGSKMRTLMPVWDSFGESR